MVFLVFLIFISLRVYEGFIRMSIYKLVFVSVVIFVVWNIVGTFGYF